MEIKNASGVPFAVRLGDFDRTRLRIGRSTIRISCLFVFGFYGAAGLLEGSPVPYDLSLASVFIVLPLMTGTPIELERSQIVTAPIRFCAMLT